MSEKRVEVKTFIVRLTCHKCGEGEMKPTGHALASNPPLYPHRCHACGAEVTCDERYPKLEYGEVE